MKSKFVSIGYSAGAIGMVEAIRKVDKKSKILALTKENFTAYGRPAIVDYAMGKIDDDGIAYKGKDYSRMRGVDTLLGKEAVKINPVEHTVKTSDGMTIEYEKLLLNIGGRPISPPIPGKELKGVMYFFNIEDARQMRRMVLENGAKRAVVIGGGLIGLKATEALSHLGVSVSIVELAPAILSRGLDPVGSGLMTKKLCEFGVNIYTGDEVVEILGDKKVKSVRLKSGIVIETDMVFISIGVYPDTKLAEECGLKVSKGIEVDRNMKTSAKDIYAAGDAAKGYNFVTKENMVIAIWPVARKMGYFAGLSMMGIECEYDGSIPMNSLYFDDLYTISFGETNPRDPSSYEILERFYDSRTYRKIFIKDGLIAGAVFVGDISRSGIVKGMIYEKIPVASFMDKLLQKDFSFINAPKKYRDLIYTNPFIDLEAV
ncbi:MAG: FAD-dependent oxidoreductase [Brevinematales bacterium]|jgi:NAD(P)H-nitrite reductase large subunit